jgi:site-specific DNA-methyltransferase (cytosine-N4-specific)
MGLGLDVGYSTALGTLYKGLAEDILPILLGQGKEKSDLILTSPPFPLNRKKKYGNLSGDEYAEWLASFAPLMKSFLKPSGSIVIEMGNAWESGRPVMSTLSLKALLVFQEAGHFSLCQQFICYNPARLPSPAQWVTVERIWVKDAFTRVWWLSPTDRPKENNENILKEYSDSMKKLLENKQYNHGKRPSEHDISATSFLKDNGGAIPPKVIIKANTSANGRYQNYCRNQNIKPHPAGMPKDLADTFIKFLTDAGDLVVDPFAGSNTTGAVAETLGRKWISIEPKDDYAKGSFGHFSADID